MLQEWLVMDGCFINNFSPYCFGDIYRSYVDNKEYNFFFLYDIIEIITVLFVDCL